jgi:ribonuclease P protein component
MIPAKYKIPQKNFTNYIRGKHVPFSLGTIIITKKQALSPGFAVVVSKKVAKKAFQRNIIKRFYYSLLQKNLEYYLENHIHIVILLKTKIEDIKTVFNKENKSVLSQELEKICKREN